MTGPYGVGTIGNTQTLSLPAGLQQGDIVFIQMAASVQIDGTQANEGVSSAGWTEVATSGVAAVGLRVWYKVMGSTPDTAVDLYEVNRRWGAIAKAWRGNIASPIDGSAVVRIYGRTTGPTPDPITTNYDNTLVIASMVLDDDDVASSVTDPTGYEDLTAIDSELDANSGGNGFTSVMAAKFVGLAGQETPGAWGMTQGPTRLCCLLLP